jgi:hypothetical protein
MSRAWPRVFFLYGPNDIQILVSSVIRSDLRGRGALFARKQIRDYLHARRGETIVSVADSGVEGRQHRPGRGSTLEMIMTIGRQTLGREDLLWERFRAAQTMRRLWWLTSNG